jgi:hypothetical protein
VARQNGVRVKDLAAQFDCHRCTISKIVQRRGVLL